MISRLQPIKKVCQQLIQQYPLIQGFFRFGSQTNQTLSDSDLDLWCVCRKFPSLGVQRHIHQNLQKVWYKHKLDLFFHTRQEFDSGTFTDPQTARPIAEFLTGDINPQITPNAFTDTSMIALYIYSTMEPIAVKSAGLNSRTGLQAIKLTRLGAIEWTHFYTMWFMHIYLQIKKDAAYIRKLAKYLSRVAVGCAISRTEENQLPQIKQQLINRLSQTQASYDAAGIDFVTSIKPKPVWLCSHTQNLLNLCAKIRNRHQPTIHNLLKNQPKRRQFCQQAEELVFYLAYQRGTDIRRKATDPFDPIVEMAIEAFLEKKQLVHFDDKEIIISAKSLDKDIYFLPRFRADHSGKSVPNGAAIVYVPGEKVVRSAGRIVGEAGPLFGIPRTANVVADERVVAYQVPGIYIKQLLESTKLRQLLDQPLVDMTASLSRKLHLLELLLVYLTYETIYYMLRFTTYAQHQRDFIDSPSLQLKQNPLRQYFIKDYVVNVEQMFAQNPHHGGLKIKTLTPSQKLFSVGDKTNGQFYVVKQGSVGISSIAINPKITVTIIPNGIFGEASLLRESKRNGTVIAHKPTTLLEIDIAVFEQLTSSHKCIGDSRVSQRNLLYHIAAVNLGRIRNNIATLT